MDKQLAFSDRKAMRPVKNSILIEAEGSGYDDISEYINWLKSIIQKKQAQYKELETLAHSLQAKIDDYKKKYPDLAEHDRQLAPDMFK